MVGIRCFEDTGDISFGNRFNIIVGQNNAGKSAFLKGILNYQGFLLDDADIRPSSEESWVTISLGEVLPTDQFGGKPASQGSMRISMNLRNSAQGLYSDLPQSFFNVPSQAFIPTRPNHVIVPFLAKRKASGFNEQVNSGVQLPITGTFHNLYANLSVVTVTGHPANEAYSAASREILGVEITTKPSAGGTVAGFYLDADNFITLDRMGDGVTEIIALITELCLARNKIFVLEEPETNLHPRGLKALLKLVRASAEYNQFFIATHSNVVVRELGGERDSLVYRVYRDGATPQSPSQIEQVERSPAAHLRLLRELGYEFTDFDLYEGWLFLEESSAERVIRDILIPNFFPSLRGRLRTFATNGVANLESSVSEFRRLITFVHLQPAYEGRLWVRADGDEAGLAVIDKMRETFADYDDNVLATFQQPQFELYYPQNFQEAVQQALALQDKRAKMAAKTSLLNDVLDWTNENADAAKAAWAASAAEPLELLSSISNKL